MQYPVYLDYNATTPCHPDVLEKMVPWFSQHFGNAASKNHPYGWIAEDAVEQAREQIAQLIGVKSKEVIFTSGATESINLAIQGVFNAYTNENQHFITCATEHKAVLDTFAYLESKGAEVTYLGVNSKGEIDLSELQACIQTNTKMIALMWANNETGIIHPIQKIAQIAAEKQIIFFTDAVQAVGKINLDIEGIHLLALSAHKFYGPKGVGALYIRHNHPLPKPAPLIWGGGHEKTFRSGTLNVPGIVGMGEAAAIRLQNMQIENRRLALLRDRLENRLLEINGTQLNGSKANRLKHVSNISFAGVEGEEFLRMLNKKIAVSSGSACTSISPKPSHVLAAMGIDSDLGRASVRFSLGLDTTEEKVDAAISHVKESLSVLRS
jgi:cysteine desulfurase